MRNVFIKHWYFIIHYRLYDVILGLEKMFVSFTYDSNKLYLYVLCGYRSKVLYNLPWQSMFLIVNKVSIVFIICCHK